MTMNLAGQTALVLGASSGMGRATTLALAAQGMHVVAAARRTERLQELAQGEARIVPAAADVTRAEDIARVVELSRAITGRLDLVVYATGTNIPDRALMDVSPARWEEMLAANLTGAFLTTQAVVPVMRQQGGGLIVYVASAAVQRPDVSGVAYQASKHGLTGLAYATRVEERDHGIRTTVLMPGLCDTEILTKRPTPTPQDVLAQALDPADVAAAVLFLAQLPPRALVPELPLVPARLW
ncbi:MAG TPA: SDR family oxidoreductase [Planctomycetaceae bacterium]|nr:SDR family oxidoreductase [Planctomycetaceae bacterium]